MVSFSSTGSLSAPEFCCASANTANIAAGGGRATASEGGEPLGDRANVRHDREHGGRYHLCNQVVLRDRGAPHSARSSQGPGQPVDQGRCGREVRPPGAGRRGCAGRLAQGIPQSCRSHRERRADLPVRSVFHAQRCGAVARETGQAGQCVVERVHFPIQDLNRDDACRVLCVVRRNADRAVVRAA